MRKSSAVVVAIEPTCSAVAYRALAAVSAVGGVAGITWAAASASVRDDRVCDSTFLHIVIVLMTRAQHAVTVISNQ